MSADSNLFDVIRRPVLTEKSSLLMGEGKYVFEVPRSATKTQVKQAVEMAFANLPTPEGKPGIKVLTVNIINVHSKRRTFNRRRKRITDWGPRWKKAIVTLKPGHSIPLYEGV